MNIDLLLAIVFYAFLSIFFMKHRSRFKVQGKIFALYKTRLGIKAMDKLAKKFPRILRFFGTASIITGFVGMVLIFYLLLKGTFDLIMTPGAPSAVAPILPGIKVAPTLPVLSFMHWIIAILIIAAIHEFSHGIYARLHNIKIRSSGFAFLGPILAAFVEPDEKQLAKKSKKAQLAVFSAGPFSNILTGFVFILALNFLTLPLYNSVYDSAGVEIHSTTDGYPMIKTGIETPFVINGIDGIQVYDLSDFVNSTKDIRPNQDVVINTNKGNYTITTVENPNNSSRGFFGVSDFSVRKIPNQDVANKFGTFVSPLVQWVHMLFFWLWVVSWGVGLFNLLPLGPVDGGRMLLTGLSTFMKDKNKIRKYWTIASMVCLLLIFINLAPYLWKLVVFIFKPLMLLFSLV
tara:strand:- start:1033 stop:2241 length:1209 start_codon:yes stop_codon:yes gene_type:complete